MSTTHATPAHIQRAREERQRAVEYIRQRAGAGASVRIISAELTARGYPAPSGRIGQPWSRTAVHDLGRRHGVTFRCPPGRPAHTLVEPIGEPAKHRQRCKTAPPKSTPSA